MNPKGPSPSLWRQTILPSLSLFTSLGTLFCCALPALLVALGMGAALAGLVGAAPWITVFSEHKTTVFLISGILIVLAATLQYRARKAPCPIDRAKAQACGRMRRLSWIILGFASLTYLVGLFFAFLAAPLFY